MSRHDPDQPYNHLPPLKGVLPASEHVEVLRDLNRASRQLGELKGSCLRLPNPGLLLSTVILQESRASSAIENIVTTQDELYRAQSTLPDQLTSPVREVFLYRVALTTGQQLLATRPVFDGRLAIRIMNRLRGVNGEGYRSHQGTRIATSNSRQTIYTPPDPDHLPAMMDDWAAFMMEDSDLDPLIRMALGHYQFEAIHPFDDGNGRTGRILNVLYLMYAGLLTEPVLYLSSYILKNRKGYYEGLRAVTEQNEWHGWLRFMMRGVYESAQRSCRLIDAIIEARQRALDDLRGRALRIPVIELVDLIFSTPYLTITIAEQNSLGSRPTVTGYLNHLDQVGLLRRERVGRRSYYINDTLLGILTKADEESNPLGERQGGLVHM